MSGVIVERRDQVLITGGRAPPERARSTAFVIPLSINGPFLTERAMFFVSPVPIGPIRPIGPIHLTLLRSPILQNHLLRSLVATRLVTTRRLTPRRYRVATA